MDTASNIKNTIPNQNNKMESTLLQPSFSPNSLPVDIAEKKDKNNLNENNSKSPNNSTKSAVQHVPCKFFKNGACTAGKNCVFSHSKETNPGSSICKYYIKGNCKFGNKCALQHGNEKSKMSGAGRAKLKPGNQYTLDKPRMYDHRSIFDKNDEMLSNSLARMNLDSTFPSFNPIMNFYTPQPKTSQLSNIFASPSPSQAKFSLPREINMYHDDHSSLLRPYDYGYNNMLDHLQPNSYSGKPTNNGFLSPNMNFNFSNEHDLLPSSLDELLTPTELQMRRTKQNALSRNTNGVINRQSNLSHDLFGYPSNSNNTSQFMNHYDNSNYFGSSLPSGSSLGFASRSQSQRIHYKGEEEVKAPNNSLLSDPFGFMPSSPFDRMLSPTYHHQAIKDREDSDSGNSETKKGDESLNLGNANEDDVPFKMDGDFA